VLYIGACFRKPRELAKVVYLLHIAYPAARRTITQRESKRPSRSFLSQQYKNSTS